MSGWSAVGVGRRREWDFEERWEDRSDLSDVSDWSDSSDRGEAGVGAAVAGAAVGGAVGAAIEVVGAACGTGDCLAIRIMA